ncbi:transposase [Streptomyces sp. NPDC002018]|uniref:transposase n=1 Tax=Streptomyces sp. NPDC002018 TaxID=3364629 RepID=UPI00367725DE
MPAPNGGRCGTLLDWRTYGSPCAGCRPPPWARCQGGAAACLASAAVDRRHTAYGIRFRVRTGVPWRDMPVEYGPWGRVYDPFRRWQRASRAAR